MSDPISMDKMGIDALKFSIDAFPMALDVYWIPIFTPSPLPASVMSMLAFYGIELKKPELKFKNSEVGVKASAYTSLGDFALYGFFRMGGYTLGNRRIRAACYGGRLLCNPDWRGDFQG